MTYQTLLFERREGVAYVTLNRADRLNALDRQLVEDLTAAAADIAADASLRAVLLTGAGRAFCSGADLLQGGLTGDAGEGAGERVAASLRRHFNPMVGAWYGLELPVVVAVNGVAAGAGAGFAMACDIVLAARSASFMQAFVRIGLVPDSGSSFFLPRLVGEARARALAMLGTAVSAEQAETWGMIWRAVDDGALMQEAEKLVGQLAAGPAGALAQMKRLLDASLDNDLDTQLDLESDAQGAAGASADFAEGVAAFLGKRRPNFGPRG
jgi:2-(1,2-epoxy-1,2-dihydrophenyl)acetyl-CoA isomerase